MTQRPFPKHEMTTRFLYVPTEDWARVRVGEKTEFRTRPREGSNLISCALPTPVVAYTKRLGGEVAARTELMVLTHRRLEPLFNISEDPDSLQREGFESYDHFRSYWKRRNGGLYKPMQKVYVWRVRAWAEGDVYRLGTDLLRELYGEHLAVPA